MFSALEDFRGSRLDGLITKVKTKINSSYLFSVGE